MNMRTFALAACCAALAVPALAGGLTDRIAAKFKVKATDTWFGGKRTIFDFNGYDAWVVEPPVGVMVPIASAASARVLPSEVMAV